MMLDDVLFFFFSSRRRHTRSVSAFLLNRSSDLLLSNRYKLITNVRSSLMAVNIHITIIELNALHTKRQNLFQELDAVIHLLMEAKHWGLRKSRNATSLNSRFKSLDTLKVKIIRDRKSVQQECRDRYRMPSSA